jgi:hypothetical protein
MQRTISGRVLNIVRTVTITRPAPKHATHAASVSQDIDAPPHLVNDAAATIKQMQAPIEQLVPRFYDRGCISRRHQARAPTASPQQCHAPSSVD